MLTDKCWCSCFIHHLFQIFCMFAQGYTERLLDHLLIAPRNPEVFGTMSTSFNVPNIDEAIPQILSLPVLVLLLCFLLSLTRGYYVSSIEWYCCNTDSLGSFAFYLIIIRMYIYQELINALSTHMIHINLNTIFYTQAEHSPTETI